MSRNEAHAQLQVCGRHNDYVTWENQVADKTETKIPPCNYDADAAVACAEGDKFPLLVS